jgi:hypothetical protein
VRAVVGRGRGAAAASSGGLTSAGVAAPHNRVRVSVSMIGFVTSEIRTIQEGVGVGCPGDEWRRGRRLNRG